MSKIIVTRGLPGSGKSTWAGEYCRDNPGVTIMERDQLRYLLTGKYYTGDQELEQKVTRLQDKLVRTALSEGVTIIISDTHLPDRSVKKWLALGHELSVPVEVKDFRGVPLEQCLVQNQQRDNFKKAVPHAVMMDKYNRFIKGRDLTKVVEYTPTVEAVIEPYVQFSTGVEAVIFDIDGTLAIMGDRSPYDPTKYHLDTLNKDVYASLEAHWHQGVDIIIVTGRDEAFRSETLAWLAANDVKWDKLYMRPTENRKDGKKTEDSIIKYGLFNKHIRPCNYRVLGVYDDRHRVLRMWRELGLTTFHVNGPDAGNF